LKLSVEAGEIGLGIECGGVWREDGKIGIEIRRGPFCNIGREVVSAVQGRCILIPGEIGGVYAQPALLLLHGQGAGIQRVFVNAQPLKLARGAAFDARGKIGNRLVF